MIRDTKCVEHAKTSAALALNNAVDGFGERSKDKNIFVISVHDIVNTMPCM